MDQTGQIAKAMGVYPHTDIVGWTINEAKHLIDVATTDREAVEEALCKRWRLHGVDAYLQGSRVYLTSEYTTIAITPEHVQYRYVP